MFDTDTRIKKIINGKKYDTGTAEYCGTYRSCYGRGDAKSFEEDLYRKKTGEFFLCGEGGALSKYRSGCSQYGWCEGWGIIPLSEEEARGWVENHMDYDAYVKIFGEPEE